MTSWQLRNTRRASWQKRAKRYRLETKWIHAQGHATVSIGTMLIFAVGMLLVVTGFLIFASVSKPSKSPLPTIRTVYVNLTILYSTKSENAWYSEGNFSVPTHTRVVFTIINQDPTTSPLLVPWDNRVVGTTEANEMVRIGNSSSETSVNTLSSTNISHTFTVFNEYSNLSAPIPPALNPLTPVTVTFVAEFDTAGTFQWGCICRCGPTMFTDGLMYGNLVVT